MREHRRYVQVDVFGQGSLAGNPVGVVVDAEGLDDETMQRIARWLNLSETTFLLPPRRSEADYWLRIFTPTAELPFAGHPTLGSCHVWLAEGGKPKGGTILQECEAGLVPLVETARGLAFAAPPLLRSGPVEEELLERIAAMLHIDRAEVLDSQWVDNGPGWVAVMLRDAEAVLALKPGVVDLDVGVVGAYPPGAEAAFEVRAFTPALGTTVEDPVTGSLNASLAGWLIESGRVEAPYTASQGTAIGRSGRVHVSVDAEGAVWVAGRTRTNIAGKLTL